ncbi:GAD-like domain-containing protein [Microbacterium sp. NPDC087665]|uniref:GAD-like domain-containing protein n=1 Tax=Microbacterium sp. NPDC087665 TaxID=3364194 RepID=UPI00381BC2A3
MVEIADFVSHAPVEPEVITEYRGRVPDELVELWEQYGYGAFGEGFLRVINPKLYEAEIGDCIGKTQGDGIAIPIMVTALGDLITWEPSLGLVAVQYRLGTVYGLGTRVRSVLRLVEDGLIASRLKGEIFAQAVEAYGELPYDQSFIFAPLLSLGGTVKVENLHKRETITAIQMMVEFQGVIGH